MEDSIFGDLNLPSMPGIKSSCEAELLKLIAEINLVVSKKYQIWKKELEVVKSNLNSQKQENEFLKAALKSSQNEIEELRDHIHTLENSQVDLKKKYENELSELRNEVKKLNSARAVQTPASKSDVYYAYKQISPDKNDAGIPAVFLTREIFLIPMTLKRKTNVLSRI
ncbi:deuterosome assembly protein 1-like [Centruroides sculpturatus]|uniref:deuterosome assembly protein 1-like n=1 Tax=Centruroides sculpturatus TaxID=218467 RepID=UPI000C6CE2B7|nr:deuterosome assembly protein 1-like [Centruroides sculpturatus]